MERPGDSDTTREPEVGDEPRPMTAQDLLDSELIGMWADRDDIGDSGEYARKLREQASQRGNSAL